MGKFSRLGNDLYTGEKSIDFVGRAWLWYAVSGVILVLALFGLLGRGLDLGIEFKGGTEYTVTLPSSQVNQNTVDKLREVVAGSGLEGAGSPVVNTSGDSAVLVTTEQLSQADSATLEKKMAEAVGVDADKAISPDSVGASWGAQVVKKSVTGLIVFLILVVLFIWAYFREWKMSVAAVVALAHDILITVGVYALSGFEVTPATVTGVLTILGFSLYDTVVVFDKVNENARSLGKGRRTYAELANLAVNQTLVRSINTSIVALLPVAAILYVGVFTLGSGSLKDLALALFVGMAVGAYSSIFIATPLLVQLKRREKAITDSDRRARARQKRSADRYAQVPAFSEGMPVRDEDARRAGVDVEGDEGAVDQTRGGGPVVTPRGPEATGSGRVVPESKGPMKQSGSAGRNQPSRQPRSKRGK